MPLNPIAQSGFSAATSYDTHRPTYPTACISALLEHLSLSSLTGGQIVEVGAGTGKFTQLLAQRVEKYEVIAVEPHEGMRKELVGKKLGERVVVSAGDAENLPVEEGWADAVIAAQVSEM